MRSCACLALALALAAPGGLRARDMEDECGRPVRLPERPARILSLCSTATDAILALGARDRLAAIDEYSRVVPGADGLPLAGKGSDLSAERIAADRYDLAFVWWYQDDAAEQLGRLDVPVFRLRSGRLAEIPAGIRRIGATLGLDGPADVLAKAVARDLAAVAPPAPGRTRVYLELYGRGKTAGRGTFLDDLVAAAGGSNVAAEAGGHAVLSDERLALAAPQVILFPDGFGDAAEIGRRPCFARAPAVRSGRIHGVDRSWLVAGPRAAESVRRLRALIEGGDVPRE